MSNAYLICGNVYHLINDEISRIVKNSNNLIKINYEQSDMQSILDEASYFSFDNENKYVIVNNCSFFSTSDSENEKKLLSYLENPNSSSVIIFVTNSIDARKKIVKIFKENNKLIELPKIDYKNIYDYINKYMGKNYSIDYRASGYLVNQFGLNLDLIYNELDKIFLYLNGEKRITLDICEKICSKISDDNCYHFIEACLQKRFDNAYKLYRDLKIYKIDDSMLLILLYKEYKKLYLIKKYMKMHYNVEEIIKMMDLQKWQIEKLSEKSAMYSEKELLSIIKQLGILDEKYKKGLIENNVAIYNYLIEIMN